MLLAISAGNTNLKFAFHCGVQWYGPWAMPANPKQSRQEIAQWYRVNVLPNLIMAPIEAAFLSVVPEMSESVSGFLSDINLKSWQLTNSIYADLGLGDEIPSTTGADRIANILAAKARFGTPAIAIDFGTATAITTTTAKRDFGGGAILPGVDLQIRSLSAGTAQLPDVPVAMPVSALGKSTVLAIQSGVIKGHVFAVQGLLLDVCAELGINPGNEPPVVCTGGRAGFFADYSPLLEKVDPLLTFEGLRLAHAAYSHGMA